MRRSPLLALAVAASLALAACGAGASPTPVPATPAPATSSPTAAPTAVPSGGPAGSPATSPAGSVRVDIRGFAFAPSTVTVAVGATVTWANGDSAPHTVTFDDGSQSSGTLAKGQTFSRIFDAPGTFTYHCSIHATMTGTVTVTG